MEQRQSRRVRTEIGVHFIVNGARAGTGVALNLSAGGLAVASDLAVTAGDEVVIDLFGGARFEGNVVRLFDGGFAMTLEMAEERRQRFSQAVDALFERDVPARELRLDRRIETRSPLFGAEVDFETPNGEIRCRVCDISLSGVRIETNARLKVGDQVRVGRVTGNIVRKSGAAYGVHFNQSFSDMAAGLNALGIDPQAIEPPQVRAAAIS